MRRSSQSASAVLSSSERLQKNRIFCGLKAIGLISRWCGENRRAFCRRGATIATKFHGRLKYVRQQFSGECYRAYAVGAAAFRLGVAVLYAVYSFRQLPTTVFSRRHVICDVLIAFEPSLSRLSGSACQSLPPLDHITTFVGRHTATVYITLTWMQRNIQ